MNFAEIAAVEAEGRKTLMDSDGYIFDVDSGEVIGHASDEVYEGEAVMNGFRVASPEGTDWVLRKIAFEESHLARVEALRAAAMANLDAMAVEPRNRLAWLHRRFDGELIQQAARDLEAGGNRSKTAKYPHGKVSLRKTPGWAEIVDAGLAVDYVAEWAPDKVRRSVGVEDVRAALAAEAEAVEEPTLRTDTARFFRSAGPSERWSIDTGIRTKGGRS